MVIIPPTTAGVVTSPTTAWCTKPAFPSYAKNLLGVYPLAFSPNGVCFATTGATFTTYNVQINSIALKGAPSSSAVPLTIVGEGFVTGLAGGRCAFTNTADGTASEVGLTPDAYRIAVGFRWGTGT